ncbi:hypothetical protein MMC14_002818 [Varicellaria rhodocarpa]|nr:hypothetical protein [Varicellaria rhodocarpa]
MEDLQPLPECIWQLRARWASTLTYQKIRDGISDHLAPASSTWKIRSMRKRFNPDVKSLLLTDTRHNLKDDQTRKTEDLRLVITCYQRLPSHESIRLLHLHPGIGNSPIEATLSTCSLTNLPSYEALSYCWGVRSGSSILCNSHSMKIQETLFHALSVLRRPDAERTLWVDAICIDQNDNDERTNQVRLMRQIYQYSTRVIVWLGEHTQDSEQGIDLILSIQKLAESDDKMSAFAQALAPDDLPKLNLPSVDSGEWGSLDNIFWRPWFTRIWIIQELAVSNDALVICGDRCLTWADLAGAAQFLMQHSLTAITKADPRPLTKLENFRQAHLTRKGNQPLLRLLLEARDAFATDDRNKIFALMGLSEREASGFVPDYSLSIEKVFVKFSKYLIEKTGTLDVLSAVEDHSYRLNKELPSWVPDWEVHSPALALSLLDQYSSWDASRGLNDQNSASFSSDSKTLIAKGITVDTIWHIGDSFLEYVPLPGTARDWQPHLKTDQAKKMAKSLADFLMQQRYRQWERMAKNNKQYPASGGALSAFIRTITADATLVSSPCTTDTIIVSPSMEEIYAAWKKYWNAASQFQGKYISTSYTSTTLAELEMAVRFMQAHHKAAYGRRFFTSKSHGYMGLCPSLTRKGDILVLLFRGRTPFILRKLGRGRLKFIGECYTYDLMHGEAFKKDDFSGAEVRVEEYYIV